LSSSKRVTGKKTSPGHVLARQAVGHPGDRADVRGDVLTGTAVATSEAAHEPSPLVQEVDRQAVDLQLAEIARRGARVALDALRPGQHVVGGESVVEAEHALEVIDGREQGRVRAAHALRGR
jgi:alpha-D-ribose 1-methylphosphonate 5-triphosphate diphosphatase PhnM